MKININTDIRYAFFNLLAVVCLGVFLRLVYIVPIPFEYNYRYILHAHSHTAFLGWIYILLVGLISREFVLPKYERKHKVLLYLTQISVLGMLFSFIFQGYGAISITFSSLFVVLSYCFAYLFLKKWQNGNIKKSVSYLFIKMGVIYLVLSSLGIWSIPFSIIKFGKDSDFYNASIAFFLHFQYNGWILSSLTGLFIRKFGWDLKYPQLIKKIFYGFQVAVIGTLVISWLGIFNLAGFYLIGGFSGIVWLFIILILSYLYFFKNSEKSLLATLFLLFFILKICVMIFGTALNIFKPVFNNPDLIISYLHLNFLGVINLGLLFILSSCKLLEINRLSVFIYLLAFIVTEILIAYKGLFLWLDFPFFDAYFLYLAIGSILFLLPVSYWFVLSLKLKNE
ncbi:hypothetical protein [Capnocytophaga stomatis]|uniref:hypothetical protein n=1 Tax=Capnocytophaga stomatis TaxID=1848904 RepID=UPI001951409F|nr:hypothetical protein [Capnocytophaga stomatis]